MKYKASEEDSLAACKVWGLPGWWLMQRFQDLGSTGGGSGVRASILFCCFEGWWIGVDGAGRTLERQKEEDEYRIH
jgi:hypothetical protein